MEHEIVTLDELARRVREQYQIKKDAEFAALLGLTRAAVSAHKGPRAQRRAKVYSEEVAIRMAELLGLDRNYALLCWAADRAKEKTVKDAWRHLAARFAGRAAAVLLVIGLALPILPSAVKAVYFWSMYIMSNLRRAWIRQVRRCFSQESGITLAM